MTAPVHRSSLAEQPVESAAHEPRPWLSALADGDVAAVEQACDAWRCDAQARADWHTYHLIGDVLRSDDLAADPARDAQFLARLRLRLADEPVVLAPQPEPLSVPAAAARRRRPVWLMPVAAAAGVAAVASVLVLGQVDPLATPAAGGWALNSPGSQGGQAQGLLATESGAGRLVRAETGVVARLGADESAGAGEAIGSGAGTGRGEVGNANARVLRDARLDHYLEAHRGALGAAVAVPGGAMRNAEVIVPVPEQR